jgi:hypothetical protein
MLLFMVCFVMILGLVFDLFLPHAAKVPMVNRVTNIRSLFIDFILIQQLLLINV